MIRKISLAALVALALFSCGPNTKIDGKWILTPEAKVGNDIEEVLNVKEDRATLTLTGEMEGKKISIYWFGSVKPIKDGVYQMTLQNDKKEVKYDAPVLVREGKMYTDFLFDRTSGDSSKIFGTYEKYGNKAKLEITEKEVKFNNVKIGDLTAWDAKSFTAKTDFSPQDVKEYFFQGNSLVLGAAHFVRE